MRVRSKGKWTRSVKNTRIGSDWIERMTHWIATEQAENESGQFDELLRRAQNKAFIHPRV